MSVRDAFERYVAVWAMHGEDDESGAVAEEIKALVAHDLVYVDVPSGHAFEGPEGIARMCALASEHYRPKIDVVATALDGDRFAIEFSCEMSVAGTAIDLNGVAVGTIAADGKVGSHRDYYDASALFAAQGTAAAGA